MYKPTDWITTDKAIPRMHLTVGYAAHISADRGVSTVDPNVHYWEIMWYCWKENRQVSVIVDESYFHLRTTLESQRSHIQ